MKRHSKLNFFSTRPNKNYILKNVEIHLNFLTISKYNNELTIYLIMYKIARVEISLDIFGKYISQNWNEINSILLYVV